MNSVRQHLYRHLIALIITAIIGLLFIRPGYKYRLEKRSTYSTGKGYEIVRQMFFAYHQLTGRKISYKRSEDVNEGVLITIFIETK